MLDDYVLAVKACVIYIMSTLSQLLVDPRLPHLNVVVHSCMKVLENKT